MWDKAVIKYGKWDNIRRGLWSKCWTVRLWNMENGTTLNVSYGQNVGRCGYGIWVNGTTLDMADGQNVGRFGYGIWENGTTLDVAYGQNVGRFGYGIWENGTTFDVTNGQNVGRCGYGIQKNGTRKSGIYICFTQLLKIESKI